ncbi:hypothetical protein [uncultured Roseobacter sp.]|uniref:hypothetical protein n=1 Tax=uncultured Roseobacter sp. TaxID=114847 RepID=UPI00261F5DA2|nr:hypothetical protein [uncultured Roseobacter sp.]
MNIVQINPKRYVKPMKSACATLTLGKKTTFGLGGFFRQRLEKPDIRAISSIK